MGIAQQEIQNNCPKDAQRATEKSMNNLTKPGKKCKN